MVETEVGHVDALVEGEEFAFEEVNAVEGAAGEEVGGVIATQSEP